MAAATVEPVVSVRGLVTRFGAQIVHDGLDLDVLPNEIFGVVGGSGTGQDRPAANDFGIAAPAGRYRPSCTAATFSGSRPRNASPWCRAAV